ncbi:hypothetical protein [Thalassotalea profundi]|uniref:Uncharacterized protein n=1 Tax=Thalassotalea profundi TaxID=2036687 RepID=A0ABQ3IR18_9GAMM|nr:hypothetical protein [Thalassotalea profundi]GHE86979.1 hypothetical protein GCM10011501_15310 [Thalassotalea profundi]
MKSKSHLLCFLLIFPMLVLADDMEKFYESIITLEMLVDHLGETAKVTKFTDQGMQFTHYYYKQLNRSFIVSDEIWEVCHTYEGATILSCFPCAKDEVSTQCP